MTLPLDLPPLVQNLVDAINAENARLTRERDSAERRLHELSNDMWSDVEFQWRKLVDVPEDSLTPGGQAIRRQLIESARKSLGVDALEARLTRERDELKRIQCVWRDQSGNDQHLVGMLDVNDLLRANWQLARVELPRVASERDQALAQRDEAMRLACYAKTGVDPKPTRRIELIALRRAADATWGPGEGKRLFPDPIEVDRV